MMGHHYQQTISQNIPEHKDGQLSYIARKFRDRLSVDDGSSWKVLVINECIHIGLICYYPDDQAGRT